MKSKLAEKNMGTALKLIHTGLAMYAQAFNAWAKDTLDDPDFKLGNDQYCGPAWKDMAKDLQTLLGSVTNLDGEQKAQLTRELHVIAAKSGINLNF